MLKQISALIKDSSKIALFHHINPDGDTLSSSYGLAIALKTKFPKKEIKVVGDFEQLISRFPFIDFKSAFFTDEIDDSWLAIIGDTSNFDRIEKTEQFQKAGKTICFDHHNTVSKDKFDIMWTEPDWIASSLQAVKIAQDLQVEFNEEIAFHLIIGIITDSGQFTFSLADPLPVETYAYLLHYINNSTMDNFFIDFRKRKVQDLEIETFMLNQMEFKNNCIVLKVPNQKLLELGVSEQDIKTKVNKLGNIEGFSVWALFTEIKTETEVFIKGSLRSNGPDVSKVAEKHGGGGHVRASGVTAKDWDEVDQIILELNEQSKDHWK